MAGAARKSPGSLARCISVAVGGLRISHPLSLTETRERTWVQIVEEKGSDVNLAARVLIDYFTEAHDFDGTVLVSNDSDLRGPVEYLWTAQWPTLVLNPHPGYSALYREDRSGHQFGTRLTLDDMMGAQVPDPLADADGNPILSKRGKPIQKPASW